jgi:hypothetical protein
VARRSETWRSAIPIVTKSKESLAKGRLSAWPRVSGPEKFFFASASMPRLGSTPKTLPSEPTSRTAPRATAAVPIATSSTFMPRPRPARRRQK